MLNGETIEDPFSILSASIEHPLEPAGDLEVGRDLIRILVQENRVGLEILADSKFELANEDLFESVQIILLVENQHSLLVINRINRTER